MHAHVHVCTACRVRLALSRYLDAPMQHRTEGNSGFALHTQPTSIVCLCRISLAWSGLAGDQGQPLAEPRSAILSSRAGMRPTALRQASDGSIYYISRQNEDRFGGSTLRRITFAGNPDGGGGVTTDNPGTGTDDTAPTVTTQPTSSAALTVDPGAESEEPEGSGDDTLYPGLIEALEHIEVDPGVGEAPLTVHFDIGWHLVPDDAN